MRVATTPRGIELYFPPLRAGYAPLALAAFGALCIVLPLLAVPGLVASGGNTHGLLAIALVGIFIAPFPAFGAAFIALAVHMLAGSLTVGVNPVVISTVRRVFGIALRRRELACGEVASIETQPAPRYQNPLGTAARFCLVARHAARRKHDLVVAENLESEAAAAQMQALIARHAGLQAHQT